MHKCTATHKMTKNVQHFDDDDDDNGESYCCGLN